MTSRSIVNKAVVTGPPGKFLPWSKSTEKFSSPVPVASLAIGTISAAVPVQNAGIVSLLVTDQRILESCEKNFDFSLPSEAPRNSPTVTSREEIVILL